MMSTYYNDGLRGLLYDRAVAYTSWVKSTIITCGNRTDITYDIRAVIPCDTVIAMP